MAMLMSGERKQGEAGYFRIGYTTLTIPPESISTRKGMNNREVVPLRGHHPMHQKTGRSQWEATVTWHAAVNHASLDPYAEWEKLRTVVAYFKVAPFIEVESAHLRQLIAADESLINPEDRLAFALRQLTITTHRDSPDVLTATLTLSLFNYRPYSLDFAYLGKDGYPVSADDSQDFRTFIEGWKEQNLRAPHDAHQNPAMSRKFGYPDIKNWDVLEPGEMTFFWREYIAVPLEGRQPGAVTLRPGGTPKPLTGGKSKIRLAQPPAHIRSAIEQACARYNFDVNLALAVCQRESSFNPRAVPIDPKTKKPASSAKGLFQMIDGTAKAMGVQNPFDPVQNANGGVKYLSQNIARYGGDIEKGLAAFAAGPGHVDRGGLQGAFNAFPWVPGWLEDIKTLYAARTGRTPAPTPAPAQETAPSQESEWKESSVPYTLSEEARKKVDELRAAGWIPDHHTDRAFFLYRPNTLWIPDTEQGQVANPHGLYPSQITVQMVNNIVPQPLAAYQYPTSQHVGPAGAAVHINFMSEGEQELDEEPKHVGLSSLAGACNMLENQFHRLRAEWKSVASVHRMQALIVENRILNMLGVYGTLLESFSTDTVPEGPALAAGSLTLMQYENVFETLGSFRVKGVTAVYQNIWNGLLSGDRLDALAKGNPRFAPLLELREQRKSHDSGPLLRAMTTEASQNRFPPVPMPVTLSASDVAILKNALSKGFKRIGDDSVDSEYPAIAKHIRQAATLTYNDYFLITNLVDREEVQEIRRRVDREVLESLKKDEVHPATKLYDGYFAHKVRTDPAFGQLVQELENESPVSDLFKNAVANRGPGEEDINRGHGAYRDLGLQEVSKFGVDLNPAYYFIDHSKRYKDNLDRYATIAANVTVGAAKAFNAPKGDGEEGHINTQLSDPEFQKQTAQGILSRLIIPYHSMKRAYPAFKLFLIEEDNSGPFHCYDDFYSYASVLSIEIIRYAYEDKPDTAVITLTNFANLLTHKLFDSTASGKFERELSPLKDVVTASDGNPVVGGGEKALIGREYAGGVNEVLDMSPGYKGKTGEAPLQYYALQTGSKIQVRMGFTNNPDKMWPVFTGTVTQIEGNEVLTIVAQGFQLELMNPAPEDLTYDGYANISTLQNALVNVAKIPLTFATKKSYSAALENFKAAFNPGAAYGGLTLFSEGGDTDSVISAVLKTSNAKHFGHWQVMGQMPERYLKGFGWTQSLAPAAGFFLQSPRAQTMVGSLYDRRDENLLINRYVNVDGSQTESKNLIRGWQYERPLFAFMPVYHVPKQPEITPWRIIKDVARRYAEYIVKVACYGFPYGADATLVFAHPNDFYISRPRLATEAEIDRVTEQDEDKFKVWWNLRGRERMRMMLEDRNFFEELVTAGMFTSTKDMLQQIDREGGKAFDAVCESLLQLSDRYYWLAQPARFILLKNELDNWSRDLRKELLALRLSLKAYLQNAAEGSGGPSNPRPGDRVQPVRKWHLVSHENIIENKIELNENIFNTVRVDRTVIAASDGIPENYRRILDCDQLIIEPVLNVRNAGMENAYAGSFLREEVGKMYRGELVLTGMPEIEPYDVILFHDPSTGMTGPIEVEKVIHSFDVESGFITIVKPRALVILNDFLSAGLLEAAKDLLVNSGHEASAYFKELLSRTAAQGTVQVIQDASMFVAVGVASAFLGAPVVPMILSYAGLKVMWMISERARQNPLHLAPLHRFGRPWVGGVNGWRAVDLHTIHDQDFRQFWAFEIMPTIESFKTAMQISQESL